MLRAIIIDDEPLAVKAVELITKEYCNFVDIIDKASIIEDAREKIIEHKPDIIILDLNMPRGTGFDLLERFPKRQFDVIIVSAHSNMNQYAMEKYQVSEFLSKPVDIDELLSAYSRILERRAKH